MSSLQHLFRLPDSALALSKLKALTLKLASRGILSPFEKLCLVVSSLQGYVYHVFVVFRSKFAASGVTEMMKMIRPIGLKTFYSLTCLGLRNTLAKF